LTSEVRVARDRRGTTEPVDGALAARGPRDANNRTAGQERSSRLLTDARSGMVIEVAPHHCFACGALNEHGIHLDLHVDGDRCWTELVLADRFQGWDGIAHGGIICTILDEVMAWSLAATDNWGLTARMSVDFKRPVRLGVPIRGEGWVTRRRRRLVDTAARLLDPKSGELLATAEAVYVAADDAQKGELMARYRFRLVEDRDDTGATSS
jgi:acyl-coenzyme A thioesterase PaaI-like protein